MTQPAEYIIRPRPPGLDLDLREIWLFRELLWVLSMRGVMVRYKQTAIGLAWALVRPLIMISIFSFIFGTFARFPSGGVPYVLIALTGVLPWQFFSNVVTSGTESVVGNLHLVTKIYFPRPILVLSACMVGITEFLVSLMLLLPLAMAFGFFLNARWLWLPVFCFEILLGALGLSWWLAAMNVYYRDVRMLAPFIIQVGLYVSPVAFSSSLVPGYWRWLYALNPVVGPINGFRWAVLGGEHAFHLPSHVISLLVIVALNLGGIWFFNRLERDFADFI